VKASLVHPSGNATVAQRDRRRPGRVGPRGRPSSRRSGPAGPPRGCR